MRTRRRRRGHASLRAPGAHHSPPSTPSRHRAHASATPAVSAGRAAGLRKTRAVAPIRVHRSREPFDAPSRSSEGRRNDHPPRGALPARTVAGTRMRRGDDCDAVVRLHTRRGDTDGVDVRSAIVRPYDISGPCVRSREGRCGAPRRPGLRGGRSTCGGGGLPWAAVRHGDRRRTAAATRRRASNGGCR